MNFSQINTFLNSVIFSNTIQNIILVILFFFVILIVFKIFREKLLKKLSEWSQKTTYKFDDVVITTLEEISPLFYYFVTFYFAQRFFLVLPVDVSKIFNIAFIVFLVFEILKFTQKFCFFFLDNSPISKDKTSLQGIKIFAKILIWAFAALFMLSNLGLDITALATSLGIGGIAIALATQNVLSDLFSSFTIYLDKPFSVGDFIVLSADHQGTVKKIGLKTTRLQTLQGEELIISNKELTEAKLRNFKKLTRRRVYFAIEIAYETPSDKINKINSIIEKIITSIPNLDFDRSQFITLGDSGLKFEIVYYVNSSEYIDYIKAHEKINFGLIKEFRKEKIEFAYPTQTLYIKK